MFKKSTVTIFSICNGEMMFRIPSLALFAAFPAAHQMRLAPPPTPRTNDAPARANFD
jgi:hypothetical protein